MKLYQKTNLLEVVQEGPIHSMVREHGIASKKIFLMPTKDLREMYEEYNAEEKRAKELISVIVNGEKEQGQEQTASKSGYNLEY